MGEDNYHRCWLMCYNRKPCYIADGKVYTPENDPLCRQILQADISYNWMFFNRDGDFCLGGKHMCIVTRDSMIAYHPDLIFTGSFHYFRIHEKEYVIDGQQVCELKGKGKKVLFIQNCTSPAYGNRHAYLFSGTATKKTFLFDLTIRNNTCIARKIPFPYYTYDFVQRTDGTVLVLY